MKRISRECDRWLLLLLLNYTQLLTKGRTENGSPLTKRLIASNFFLNHVGWGNVQINMPGEGSYYNFCNPMIIFIHHWLKKILKLTFWNSVKWLNFCNFIIIYIHHWLKKILKLNFWNTVEWLNFCNFIIIYIHHGWRKIWNWPSETL